MIFFHINLSQIKVSKKKHTFANDHVQLKKLLGQEFSRSRNIFACEIHAKANPTLTAPLRTK
jgi:hypothetical protein